jgi:catechol 2,3-dioxygenase-like lactoylglutathione lyase family enzyme
MKVKVISIPVQDQEKALEFYTKKLGFVKKLDIPLGGDSRWLTVVSNEERDGPKVLLEPSPHHFEPAKHIKKHFLTQEFLTHNSMSKMLNKNMSDSKISELNSV